MLILYSFAYLTRLRQWMRSWAACVTFWNISAGSALYWLYTAEDGSIWVSRVISQTVVGSESQWLV